jgi:hypothetical protein
MLDPEQVLRDHAKMKADRSGVEGEWRDVSDLVEPAMRDSFDSAAMAGFASNRPRTERIYDETAILALGDGCSVFEGEVMPDGSVWQQLKPRDEVLLRRKSVALWYEQLTGKLHALRSSAASGWAIASHRSVKNLLAYGMQSTWPEIMRDCATGRATGISYCSDKIGQLYVRDGHAEQVETTHREFTLTHREALGKWKDNPPECALKAQRDQGGKNLDASATYVHVMTPNPRYEPDRIDWQGKPWASAYLSVSDKAVFDFGGYRTRRQVVSRLDKALGPYGRGRIMDVLPAIRAAQAMMRDLVTIIEFIAKPALGASDDMMDQILMYSPGGVTYGAIDPRGNAMIKRLWDDPDIGPALELLREVRGLIGRACFQDLYMIRDEVKSHVSAFERMTRDQQKGIMLAPLKRQETEWFTPLAAVELDLMAEMGMLDDMPREVAEAGGLYQIVYDNPLNRSRKAAAAAGFYGMLDGLGVLFQLNPEAVQEFFRKYPFARVLDGLGDIHGVPVSWEATEEEMAAAQEEINALATEAKFLEVAERASVVSKNLAGAMPPEMAAA